MADLDFVKVVGRLGLVVGDTTNDVDTDPDTVWCDFGEVWFTPLNVTTKVVGSSPVPATLGQAPIKAAIDSEGYLSYLGQRFVKLVDLTSSKVNPVIPAGKATHRVEFRNIRANGQAISFDSFNARFSSDSLGFGGAVDLTLAAPVPAAGGVAVVVGPRGVSVTDLDAVGGNLIYTLSDGSTGNAGELPVGPGGSNASTAEYLTQAGPSKTALDAAIAAAGASASLETIAVAGSAKTLNKSSVHDVTLSAATCTLTLPSGMPSAAADQVVVVRQPAAGGKAVTFAGNVTWLGAGTQPPLNAAANGVTIFTFFSVDGGSSWYGSGTVEVSSAAHKATHAPGGSDAIDYTLVNRRGALADRPAASAGLAGTTYFAEDDRGGTNYRCDGSSWRQSGRPNRSALMPAKYRRTNVDRTAAALTAPNGSFTSGTPRCMAIELEEGDVISTLYMRSGGTAGAGLTHRFAMLCDANNVVLAVTADNTGATVNANEELAFPLASAFTVPAKGAGLYYAAFCFVGTTIPNARALATDNGVIMDPPILSGNCATTGLTAPPAVGTALGLITSSSPIVVVGAS